MYVFREITRDYYWEIMSVLVERPATVDQLVKKTGFSRNKVLGVTKSLSDLGLIKRPRRRKAVEGLIVAYQPELLKAFMVAFETYYSATREEIAGKAAREAERLRVLMEPKPPWTPTLVQGGAA